MFYVIAIIAFVLVLVMVVGCDYVDHRIANMSKEEKRRRKNENIFS